MHHPCLNAHRQLLKGRTQSTASPSSFPVLSHSQCQVPIPQAPPTKASWVPLRVYPRPKQESGWEADLSNLILPQQGVRREIRCVQALQKSQKQAWLARLQRTLCSYTLPSMVSLRVGLSWPLRAISIAVTQLLEGDQVCSTSRAVPKSHCGYQVAPAQVTASDTI